MNSEPMTDTDSVTGEFGQRFYGKYRGLVINNIDPEQIGRVMVQVPDVLGMIPSSWAMPSKHTSATLPGEHWRRRALALVLG